MKKQKNIADHEGQPAKTEPTEIRTPAPNVAALPITDVKRNFWRYALQQGPRRLLKPTRLPFLVAWELVWYELLIIAIRHDNIHPAADGSPSLLSTAIWWLMLVPIVMSMAWFNRLRDEFESAFLEQFAAANGYRFTPEGSVDKEYGTIFRLPGTQHTSNAVSGTYASGTFQLFLLETKIEMDHRDYAFNYTVVELELPGQLPHLLLVDKHWRTRRGGPDMEAAFGVKNTVMLKGDFNQRFRLHAPDSSQVEALEVFSPDTMALMEDVPRHYAVEFVGNRIYIYTEKFITDSASLAVLFALTRQLVTKLTPVASRLAYDTVLASGSEKFRVIKQSKSLAASDAAITLIIGFFTYLPFTILWLLLLVLAKRQAGS